MFGRILLNQVRKEVFSLSAESIERWPGTFATGVLIGISLSLRQIPFETNDAIQEAIARGVLETLYSLLGDKHGPEVLKEFEKLKETMKEQNYEIYEPEANKKPH